MKYNLDKKIALITGASRGIGKEIANHLAMNGAQVIINYANSEQSANDVAAQINQNHPNKAFVYRFDVSNNNEVDQAIKAIKDRFGMIDILVNNAGITNDKLIIRTKDDDWSKVIDTNLSGAFYCCKAVAKDMMKNRSGRIINIASVSGQAGNAGQVSYCCAKAGMIGLSKALALELASRKITVNTVSPGYIETDMTSKLTPDMKQNIINKIPLGFVGKPSDIANAVVFLSSDQAQYITGQTIAVNGGLYM